MVNFFNDLHFLNIFLNKSKNIKNINWKKMTFNENFIFKKKLQQNYYVQISKFFDSHKCICQVEWGTCWIN
jgi:hypothetical protein